MASELLPKVKSLTNLGPNYCGLDILVSSCAWQVNNTSGPVTMWLRRKDPVRNFSLWIGTFFFFFVCICGLSGDWTLAIRATVFSM